MPGHVIPRQVDAGWVSSFLHEHGAPRARNFSITPTYHHLARVEHHARRARKVPDRCLAWARGQGKGRAHLPLPAPLLAGCPDPVRKLGHQFTCARSRPGLLFKAKLEILHARTILAEVEQAKQRARSKIDVLRLGINLEIDLVFEADWSGEDHLQKLWLAVHHGGFMKGFQGGLQSNHGLRRRPGVAQRLHAAAATGADAVAGK